MSTPMDYAAIISDRQRLWEVRKYCQVKAVLGRNDVNDVPAKEPQMEVEPSHPDPALSSLLQLLMNELEADVVMVSLLDEETQFFLAGARKDSSTELPVEFTKWFGCDQVSHFGGLCERTIAVDSTQPPAIYEELDMSKDARTRNLPYVNGTLAKFRYYAGAPVRTATGIPIGTVFVLSHQPSSGLGTAKQQLLTDTADNVMRQLALTLQALEGERLMQFQSATSALLLQRQRKTLHQRAKGLARKQSGLNRQPDYILEVYQHAAEVMRRSLGLEGVLFQHVPSESHPQTTPGNSEDSTLATSLNAESGRPSCLSRLDVDKIIKMFPQGAVLHHLDGDWLTSTLDESQPSLDPDIKDALHKSFEGAQQLLVQPLFDVIHDRTSAICIGWLNDYSRVYSDRSDLPFVSAFCMSTMSEGLRLETQMLERIKSDFLGSISHEMKTPLHQILGNLELLLQTNCSDEQCDLVVNARFGGTQLLETINKILQYSNISSEADTKPEDTPETNRTSDEKEVLQIIGPRVEHIAGAASSVDLVRMCEEVVEDTTKRMRLLETIMTPSEEEDHKPEDRKEDGSPGRRADGSEKHPFTIVVFDASPIDRVQIPRNTGFRIVLENLLSNAIKFTRAGCCARVSLKFSSETVDLVVSDCGYGMSEDFVRHNIYLPFSQQDPVASGMGLGLSLVKRNIDSLGGTVDIETDQELGTTAKISVQTENLAAKANTPKETGGKGQIPLGVVPYMPKRSKDDLPFMHACFYAPSTWIHRYDKRDQRSIDLMFDSLSATLSEWYQPVLSLWQHETRTAPDLIFISQHNLAQFQEESGGKFANVKKVVICAAIGKNSSQDREKIRQASEVADALITGAVLPSKLWEVVTGYFPHILQPGSTPEAQGYKDTGDDDGPNFSDSDEPEEAVDEDDEDHGSSSRHSDQGSGESEQAADTDKDNQGPDDETAENLAAVGSKSDKETDVKAGANPTSEDESTVNKLSKTMTVPAMDTGKAPLKRNVTVPIFQGSSQPRMLLVDDNNLNLKMLGMLVKKCGIPVGQSTSVPGGQEAIDAFKENDGTANSFDIILMDLSMPEVSGFDATSAIREIEKASGHDKRAYIVALTGLVSDKDRNAAFEAGVDDYVTKPAGLEKVRSIIDMWQKKDNDSDGSK